MKILLINPPAENLVKTFAPEALTEEMGFYPPMGLLYVAAGVTQAHGDRFQIEVLDTQVERMSYAQIERHIAECQPDVVGISCMTFLLIDALKVGRAAKRVDPKIHVVMGGTHPSIYPEEMASQPDIDSIVMGEGEHTFAELLSALEESRSLEGIAGVGYKQNGRVVINPARGFIQDLDSLPFPDRNLLPTEKYYNVLGDSKVTMTSLVTTRGCPFRCTFCTNKDGKACRMRSPENVVQEIEACYARGVTDFDIIDDTFTINKKRALAIADLILEKGLKITMDLRARVDTVDQEVLDRLAEAGCNRIRFGVESGDPGVLENIQKGITLEQIRAAYSMARKAGMVTFAYFMLGMPGETAVEIKKSLDLAKELRPDFAQFLIFTPFPATPVYDEGMEKGVLEGDYWREFSAHPTEDFVAQWWTENFTHEELEKWQRKVHLSYYYRPAYVWSQLRQVRSFKELLRKARIAVRMITG
ncbi:MAG: radical SAM protein [Candidatus Aminicenantaceae bacterium]